MAREVTSIAPKRKPVARSAFKAQAIVLFRVEDSDGTPVERAKITVVAVEQNAMNAMAMTTKDPSLQYIVIQVPRGERKRAASA